MEFSYKQVPPAEITPRRWLAPFNTEYTPEETDDVVDSYLTDLEKTLYRQGRDLNVEHNGFTVADVEDWYNLSDTETVNVAQAQKRYENGAAILESELASFETDDKMIRGTISYVPRARADEYLADGGNPRDKQQLDTVNIELELAATALPPSHAMSIIGLTYRQDHTLGFSGIGFDHLLKDTKELYGAVRERL